jgi:hypothetical protein
MSQVVECLHRNFKALSSSCNSAQQQQQNKKKKIDKQSYQGFTSEIALN